MKQFFRGSGIVVFFCTTVFAFSDINDHLGRFIINLLQITVSMLLIAFAVISISNANNFQNRMSRLENKKNIYIMDDITEMKNPEHFNNIYDPEYRDKYLTNAIHSLFKLSL